MLLPSQLSVKPNATPITVPEYDFEGQNRWDGAMIAMATTSSTKQTFDNNGKPRDQTSDAD